MKRYVTDLDQLLQLAEDPDVSIYIVPLDMKVNFMRQTYQKGVRLSQAAMSELEKRLERLTGLEKYFVPIRPLRTAQSGLFFIEFA